MLAASYLRRPVSSELTFRPRFLQRQPSRVSPRTTAMASKGELEIVEATQAILDAIATGNWQSYEAICLPEMTCAEPEADCHVVKGLDFHRFYFENLAKVQAENAEKYPVPWQIHITGSHVHQLSDDSAVITYTRIDQVMTAEGPVTRRRPETRVWKKVDGQWRLLHFHKS